MTDKKQEQFLHSFSVDALRRLFKPIVQVVHTGGWKVSHAEVAAISAKMVVCRDENYFLLLLADGSSEGHRL